MEVDGGVLVGRSAKVGGVVVPSSAGNGDGGGVDEVRLAQVPRPVGERFLQLAVVAPGSAVPGCEMDRAARGFAGSVDAEDAENSG